MCASGWRVRSLSGVEVKSFVGSSEVQDLHGEALARLLQASRHRLEGAVEAEREGEAVGGGA